MKARFVVEMDFDEKVFSVGAVEGYILRTGVHGCRMISVRHIEDAVESDPSAPAQDREETAAWNRILPKT